MQTNDVLFDPYIFRTGSNMTFPLGSSSAFPILFVSVGFGGV